MLILSRKSNESVVVSQQHGSQPMLTVTVLEINGNKVRLGFEADARVPIHRSEVWERIRNENQPDAPGYVLVSPDA